MDQYSEIIELMCEVEERLNFVLTGPTTSVWVTDILGPVTQRLTKILDEEGWPRSTENEERME